MTDGVAAAVVSVPTRIAITRVPATRILLAAGVSISETIRPVAANVCVGRAVQTLADELPDRSTPTPTASSSDPARTRHVGDFAVVETSSGRTRAVMTQLPAGTSSVRSGTVVPAVSTGGDSLPRPVHASLGPVAPVVPRQGAVLHLLTGDEPDAA